MHLATIDRPPSLVEKVCERLAELARHNPQANGLLPTERQLSEKLGVSRSVVREAAKRLEMQGLLEIRQGIGIKAVDKLHKPLTSALALLVTDEEERLRQLVEVRFMIEPENARHAAERATRAQIDMLQGTHQKLIEAKDFESAVRADIDFHRVIALASGNQISALLLLSLSDLLQASLARGYRRVTTESAIKEHGQILSAITRRDSTGAWKSMRKHIDTTRDELGLSADKVRPKKMRK